MPHFITFANEKGGTGKSTTAVHSAVALAAQGRRVAAIDLDTRQRTLGRYLDNRAATARRTDMELPMPVYATFDPGNFGAYQCGTCFKILGATLHPYVVLLLVGSQSLEMLLLRVVRCNIEGRSSRERAVKVVLCHFEVGR